MKTLIDKAIKVCGGVAKLAVRLDVQANVISMHRSGRPLSPETASELAYVTGDDACQAAIEAMVFRAKGKKKETLIAIFRKQISSSSTEKHFF